MKTAKGRPSTYSEPLADEICQRLSSGESLMSICRDPRMPPESTVRFWAVDDRDKGEELRPGFVARYARARAYSHERMAEEIIEIGDADYTGPSGLVDNAAVQRARLMCDNRKWLLSKLLPRQFGDKVTQELVGSSDQPVITRIELIGIAPAERREEAPPLKLATAR